MEATADGTATRQAFADVLPLHPAAPQLDDEGVFLGRPFGLLLGRGLGRVRGLQALGRAGRAGLAQRRHHGGRARHEGRRDLGSPRHRPGGIDGGGNGRGFFLILGLE